MKKRILSLLLSTALVAAALVNPMVSKANSEEAGAPTEMTIDDYRTEITSGTDANGNAYEYYTKVPTAPEGYIFGGWYTTEDCNQAISKTKTTGTAWAKWVDKDVLAVKYQVSASTSAASQTTNMRLVTSVDSENYRAVGFVLNYGQGDSKPAMSKDVYSSIKGLVGGVETYYYANQEFDATSQYFMIYEIFNIPQGVFDASINVMPQWETLDGTIVKGTSNTVKISDVYADKATVNADGSVTVVNRDGNAEVPYTFTGLGLKTGDKVTFTVTLSQANDNGWIGAMQENGAWPWQDGLTETSYTRELTIQNDTDTLQFLYKTFSGTLGDVTVTYKIDSIAKQDSAAVADDGTVTIVNSDGNGDVSYRFTGLDIKAGDTIEFTVTTTSANANGWFGMEAYHGESWIGWIWQDDQTWETYTRTMTVEQDIDSLYFLYKTFSGVLGDVTVTFKLTNLGQ